MDVYRTSKFSVTLVDFISTALTVMHFLRQYDAYELNQCKLKMCAYNILRMIRTQVKQA